MNTHACTPLRRREFLLAGLAMTAAAIKGSSADGPVGQIDLSAKPLHGGQQFIMAAFVLTRKRTRTGYSRPVRGKNQELATTSVGLWVCH